MGMHRVAPLVPRWALSDVCAMGPWAVLGLLAVLSAMGSLGTLGILGAMGAKGSWEP